MKPKAAAFLVPCLAVITASSLSSQSPPAVWNGPVLVSPGGRGAEGQVGSGCPTFSWALVPEASGYELDVYDAASAGRERDGTTPLLHVEFPAGVGSWTPELRECLAPGRYGWAVAAMVKTGASEVQRRWSKPALFHVEDLAVGHHKPERPAHTAATIGAGAVGPRLGVQPGAAADGAPPRTATGEVLFTPQACSGGGEMFTDVPASSPFCRWIEQLARDGISSGCGGGKFCPGEPVTREQMALLLERAMRGTQDFAPAPGGAILTAVDDPVEAVGSHTSIAIGTDGLPIISYYDQTAQALKVAHCWDRACAGGYETITTVDDPANNVGLYTSIAIGAEGLPIISYWDATAHRLKVAKCADVSCATLPTITTVNNPSGNLVGQFSSIAIGSDGRPIVSYYDATATDLVVAYCNDAACAGSNETITTVDSTNNVGQFSSIAIGTDDLPIISYFDQTATALKVAHCNDVACVGANETITTVDNAADVGRFSSIAIGADDLPIISHYDATAFALKVTHCNDVACAGADETNSTVDDPTSAVGSQTSLAIGADGLPVISYSDDTATAL
jgi:hypothetical protein